MFREVFHPNYTILISTRHIDHLARATIKLETRRGGPGTRIRPLSSIIVANKNQEKVSLQFRANKRFRLAGLRKSEIYQPVVSLLTFQNSKLENSLISEINLASV